MNSVYYLSTAYLPPVQYFAKLMVARGAYVEQHDHYMKQTYRNRCIIAGPEGKVTLTVPIEKPDTLKCETKDVRISQHGNWRHLHLTALESAYGKTPYFEFYRDDFAPFYEKPFHYLIDFNEQLTQLICSLADLHPNICRTAEYKKTMDEGEVDCREIIHPKKAAADTDPHFRAEPYYQVFRERLGFLPNLSMVDLLFNMGPESPLVLEKCIQQDTHPCYA